MSYIDLLLACRQEFCGYADEELSCEVFVLQHHARALCLCWLKLIVLVWWQAWNQLGLQELWLEDLVTSWLLLIGYQPAILGLDLILNRHLSKYIFFLHHVKDKRAFGSSIHVHEWQSSYVTKHLLAWNFWAPAQWRGYLDICCLLLAPLLAEIHQRLKIKKWCPYLDCSYGPFLDIGSRVVLDERCVSPVLGLARKALAVAIDQRKR